MSKRYGLTGPKTPPKSEEEKFNLFGFILYDQLDEDTADFMSKNGGWISSATGDHCWITIFENPEFWEDNWKNSMKEIYGMNYEEYIKKWEMLDPSYRNTSHEIARELEIPITIFPSIIFLESLESKKFIQYPLINDNKFYRELFSIVAEVSADPDQILQKLEKEVGALKWRWFIPKKIQDRAEIFDVYADTILNIGKPFLEILKSLKSI